MLLGLIAVLGLVLLVAMPLSAISVKVTFPEGRAAVGYAPRLGVWLGASVFFILVGVATCVAAVGWLVKRLIGRLRRR